MGKSVAIQLAEKGANVIIVARDVKKLEDALREIKVFFHPLFTLNKQFFYTLAPDTISLN